MPKQKQKTSPKKNNVVQTVVESSAVTSPKSKKKSLIKKILLALGAYLLLNIGVFYLAIYTTVLDHPVLQRFEQYGALENWNLTRHLTDVDIDGDGKRDMITFTGCAFISSVTVEMIPANKRCTADGMGMIGGFPNESVGQKYTTLNESNLSLRDGPWIISYSYAGKYNDGPWQIYIKEKNAPFKVFGFNDQYLLEEKSVPVVVYLDYAIYQMGKYAFFLIALPMQWFFSVINAIQGR